MLGNMRFALPRVRNNCDALLLKELIKSAIDRHGVVRESEGFEAASFFVPGPAGGRWYPRANLGDGKAKI